MKKSILKFLGGGGTPRHYYTVKSNILPELVISPLRSSYIRDEFGNPARTIDALREAQQYGGHVGVIRDEMSGRELRNNLKFQGRDEYLAQQREADQIARDRTDGLSEGFANLMTFGAASTLKDGAQDINNGHYISGAAKLATPFVFPAVARTPLRVARGIVGGLAGDMASNYIYSNTFGRGKNLAQEISDATGGRISEEEGHLLNPAMWWGARAGIRYPGMGRSRVLGMNGAVEENSRSIFDLFGSNRKPYQRPTTRAGQDLNGTYVFFADKEIPSGFKLKRAYQRPATSQPRRMNVRGHNSDVEVVRRGDPDVRVVSPGDPDVQVVGRPRINVRGNNRIISEYDPYAKTNSSINDPFNMNNPIGMNDPAMIDPSMYDPIGMNDPAMIDPSMYDPGMMNDDVLFDFGF